MAEEKQEKAKKEKKPVNFKAKYIALGVLVAVLIVAIVLVIVFSNKGNDDAAAVMQLETNPGVQLVLNGNDKVIGEVALNADGEKLLANVSFIGLKAEVAAEKFASTAAGMDKINDSTTSTPAVGKSTTVKITISAEKTAEYSDLASKAKKAVNDYFADNGIFAGAVTSVNTDIKAALNTMGASAAEYANMTTKELLEFAKTTANDLDKVAIELRSNLTTKFEQLYNTILKAHEATLDLAKKALDAAKQAGINVDNAQKAYDNALAEYKKFKAELEKQYKDFVKQVQTQSEQILNAVKTAATQAYNETVALYNAHVQEFKNLANDAKQARKTSIAEFQASLSVQA